MAAAHPDPFSLTLDELRRRTSQKWRYYPAEAIPAWIAEMDVIPAEAVIDAVTHAMTTGDTGYSMSGGYLAAMADFARDRWDWEFDPSEGTGVADVMSGIGALIRCMAVELGKYGIRANSIAPGYIKTEMTGSAEELSPIDQYFAAKSPIPRPGYPADFEAIAAYLACDASAFHSGDTIVIDGASLINL